MARKKRDKNYAFIDGNNLYLGAKSQNISLDYGVFRQYLRNKLSVDKAFIFIGYDHRQAQLYTSLQRNGFVLVFKPVVQFVDKKGKRTMKGNVDAELVLHTSAIEFNNYNKAVIVSSDGDFSCLLSYLVDNNKLLKVITPTTRYSKLLGSFNKYILPLNLIKDQIKRN